MRDEARTIARLVLDVVDALIEQAAARRARPCPSARTSRHGQPVLLAHHLLATRGRCCATSTGSSTGHARRALAVRVGGARGLVAGPGPGSSARETGFNSIDGTASRDVVAEFAFVAAMLGVDLSRLGGHAVGATKEFGFVRLHDSYSTGSSIMPQKKNPDVAELARGKAPPHGDFKGLPLAYNRDLQEDKEPVFDQVDTLEVLLPGVSGMVATLEFDTDRMASLAPQGFSLATDVAEWLVREGVPFRVAHEVAGACVRACEERGIELWDLSDDDLASISEHLTPGVRDVLSVEGSLASRDAVGGTAPVRVAEQLEAAKERSAEYRFWAQD